ncbi:unnamed protein product [Discosporangium mesarthrocarpum]
MPGLGFNCRTERDRWRAGGVVPGEVVDANFVGPGSYEVGGPSASSHRPGYAPFLSTSERKFTTNLTAEVPGPGFYLKDSCHSRGKGRITDVFKSTSRRFQMTRQQLQTPGPGSYLGQESLGSKEKVGKGEDGQKIKWVRVPTAPSIPGREQSYGYEEGDHGELIMQRPVQTGHTGKGDDRPGPVDYQPRDDFGRKSSAAVDFSKGSDRLVALEKARASTTPGPGHYNSIRGLADTEESTTIGHTIHYKRPRPMAVFHTSMKKDKPQKRSEPLPGPGDYSLPGAMSIAAARDPARKDLSFMSTTTRFVSPAAEPRSRAPGPGSYGAVPSDFDQWQQTSGRGRHKRVGRLGPVGFQSTSLRFGGYSRSDPSLGPASYRVPGMAEEVARRVSAKGRDRGGAFGSTTKRFMVYEGGQAKEPGPGSYDFEVSTRGGSGVGEGGGAGAHGTGASPARTRKKLPSRTKRFAQPASKVPGPAPGHYDIKVDWESKGVLPIGKVSSTYLEMKPAGDPGLGPGSYNVQDITGQGRVKSRKNIMVCSQVRFSDPGGVKTDVPGPGHYSSRVLYGNLIKQTYNIAIAEQSAEIF